MIKKTHTVICDICLNAINDYMEDSIKNVKKYIIQDRILRWKGKHFCTDECERIYVMSVVTKQKG